MVAAALLCGLVLGLARALPLAGFAIGAVLGTRLPLLLGADLDSDYSLVAALPAALLLGALLAALVERYAGRLARWTYRRATVDAVGGALVGGVAGVVAVWMLAPVAAEVPSVREPVERSDVLARFNGVLTPAGPRRSEDAPAIDNLPRFAGPGPNVAPGDPGILFDPDVLAAERSVLRIAVMTCDGHRGGGSGWVGADGIVVTNAHVVAGSRMVTVQRRGRGAHLRAVPIWFDGEHDIALLRVAQLRGLRPLPMVREPRRGTSAATLGFPLGRRAIRRARVGPTTARLSGRLGGRPSPGVSDDINGRLVTMIRGRMQPGNSGGPVIDQQGRVLTTAFAGGFGAGALGVPNRYVRSALRQADPRVARKRRCL